MHLAQNTISHFDHLKQLVIAELRSFQTCTQANKLTINYDPQKSGYCVSKPKNRILPYSYNHGLVIGENNLCYRECTKYLGLFLDDQLTWKRHVTETNKKIIKYAGIFNKMRQLLPEECLNTLYNPFVFSRLNYVIEVYVDTEKKFLTPLKTSQNKLLRILQFKHRPSPVNDLYKSFGVLKLTDMHKYNLIILMHKHMHHPNKIP